MQAVLRNLVAISFLVAFLGACSSTPTATTDFDQDYDFSAVKSVALKPFSRASPESVMISDLQVARINTALIEELKSKGIEVEPDKTRADLILSWHVIMQERADVRSYNTASAYRCWRCSGVGVGVGVSDVSVRYYTQGTFIVDMIDPEQQQSVWRSVFESRIKQKSDPEEAAENRREAVSAILADFPPVLTQ